MYENGNIIDRIVKAVLDGDYSKAEGLKASMITFSRDGLDGMEVEVNCDGRN